MSIREQVRGNSIAVIVGVAIAVVGAVVLGLAFKASSDYRAAGREHARAEETRKSVLKILGVDPDKAVKPEEVEARAGEANKLLAMLSAPAVFQGRALSIDIGEGKTRAISVGELLGVLAQERAAAILQSQAQAPPTSAKPGAGPGK